MMEYRVGGFIFDEWKIVRRLGNGASGIVYEIQKADHDVILTSALKVMCVPQDSSIVPSLYGDGLDEMSVTSYLQDVVDELIGEIKIMVSMKGFPYTVSCEDYKVVRHPESAQWDVLIRMELLTPLQTYQREHGMTEADVHRLGLHLTKALMLFEERGIIHRDIKPENIFVNAFGDFKVGDFGIARAYSKACGNLSKKGTENYMAPEIYRGDEYDNTVDIYSLGLVLYRLLNKNRLPFYPMDVGYREIDRQQAIVDRMCGQKEIPLPAYTSPEFGRIVLKMCAYRSEHRYQSAGELLRDLEALCPSDEIVIQKTDAPSSSKLNNDVIENQGQELTSAVFGSRSREAFGSCSHNQPEQEGGMISACQNERNVEEHVHQDEKSKTERVQPSEPESGEQIRRSKRRIEERTHQEEGHERDLHKQKKNSRKPLIQALAVVAIILAVAVPMYMSKKYSLSVNGGSGSGSYKSGASVTVRAKDVEGSSFKGWDVTGIELSEEDRSYEELTFSMPRNSVTLTAEYEENMYAVTVNGGSGSGTYSLDETVTIEAASPEEGYCFDTWKSDQGFPNLSDPSAEKTSFKMEEEEVVLTASYKPLEYDLVVDGAKGSGTYTFGDKITLEAEQVENSTFEKWIMGSETLTFTEEELASDRLSFTMPAEEVTITAQYKLNEHTVTVNSGKGSGTYTVGDRVTITAEEAEEGSSFASWKVKEGDVSIRDESEPEISFTMPDGQVEITAQYEEVDYTVTVNNGSGGGMYHLGDKVSISADPMRNGMIFSHWTVDKGTVSFVDTSVQNIIFEMPAEELILTANYVIQKYTLKVTDGKGSGMYQAGDEVEISAASQDANGNAFGFWSVTEGNLDFEKAGIDTTQNVIRIRMPEQNLVLKANYTAPKAETAAGYTLSVNGGSGSGTYAAGETIKITHAQAPAGMMFAYWLLNQAGAEAVTYKSDVLTLTMPANNVVVTAVFEDQM